MPDEDVVGEFFEEEQQEEETMEEEERGIGYCKVHGKVEGVYKGKGRGRKLRCPICNRIVKLTPYEDEEKETEKTIDFGEEEEEWFEEDEEFFVDPEQEFHEKAIEYLRRELPKYGICKGNMLKVVISSLQINPELMKNPQTLHMHIKSIVRNVNDYLLTLVIRGLFNKYGDLLQQPSVPVIYDYNNPPAAPHLYPSTSPSQPPSPYPAYPSPYPQQPQQVPIVQPQVLQPAKPKKTYKIAIDGQTIEVDDYKEYLALKEWEMRRQKEEEERERRRQEHEMRMKKLEMEIMKIAKEREEEDEPPRASEDSEMLRILNSRIASLENYINKLSEEREELLKKLNEMEARKKEEEIRMLRAELEQLRKIAEDPFDLITKYEERLRRLGYLRGGKSLLDILAETQKNIDETIKLIVSRMPQSPYPQAGTGIGGTQTFIPSGGRYTEDERLAKLSELKNRIGMTEEEIEAEEEYLEAMRKIYSSQGQDTHQR